MQIEGTSILPFRTTTNSIASGKKRKVGRRRGENRQARALEVGRGKNLAKGEKATSQVLKGRSHEGEETRQTIFYFRESGSGQREKREDSAGETRGSGSGREGNHLALY